MEPEILTRGQMGAIFYIYSLSTTLICFLVIDLCYIHNRCIIFHKNGIFNAKFIFNKGSSRAKIYSVFKYANFGSLTAPEAFIMLFCNGIPFQRVIPMLYHTIKLKYPSGAKWEPFLHIFAVYVKSGSKTTPNSIPAYLDATGSSIRL